MDQLDTPAPGGRAPATAVADAPAREAGHESTARAATVLAVKRAEIEDELAGIVRPADEGGITFGKRVGDGTAVAVERLAQVAVHDGIGSLHAEVLRAQAKLAEGTYGCCDRCGTVIPATRLEALPWATHCVTCPAVA
jgi:DnaK suppressor protein